MKNKIICIGSCFLILIVTFLVAIYFNEKNYVYHQHIEEKNHPVCNHEDIFCTHLPIVTINTGNQSIPGEQHEGIMIDADIQIYQNGDDVNHLTDTPKITSNIKLRYRGNSSVHFDKKGYQIKFVKEDGTDRKVSVLGMPSDEEWVLHGPYLDKTLLRNYMWYNISHEIMGYAPNTRFCEVFVDGEYQGLYVMVESVSYAEGSRVPISKYNPRNPYTSYVVRLDRGTLNPSMVVDSFSNYTYHHYPRVMSVIYPEKTLYSFDYDNSRIGYSNLIDVDSFVNYFIINEFLQNYDALSFYTYLYKDVKGKFGLYVWDFNNAIDNYQETAYSYDEDYHFPKMLWYFMLFKDEDFVERVIHRYKYLRETYLSDSYLNQYIDETISYLGPAIQRNFDVWGYTFQDDATNLLEPSTRNLHSYEEAIEQVKMRLQLRGQWMDQTIDTLRQFSHKSKVKKFNH